MKSIVFCLAFFCTLSSAFSQSYILDFELKKVYGNPYVFTDSSTQHTYFVFVLFCKWAAGYFISKK